jgi:hypothetical protein
VAVSATDRGVVRMISLVLYVQSSRPGPPSRLIDTHPKRFIVTTRPRPRKPVTDPADVERGMTCVRIQPCQKPRKQTDIELLQAGSEKAFVFLPTDGFWRLEAENDNVRNLILGVLGMSAQDLPLLNGRYRHRGSDVSAGPLSGRVLLVP